MPKDDALDDFFDDSWRKHGKGGLFDPWGPPRAATSATTAFTKCSDTHKPLALPDGLVIYGGSCLYPMVQDADVYIGFDSGMHFSERNWPWKPGYEVLFKIRDMDVPDNVVEFRALIKWTIEQLAAGKKVHAGCIGGHGRTGLFFAALLQTMTGETDAITAVRQGYCKKAVESSKQVSWLVQHFGVKAVPGGKSYASAGTFLIEHSVKQKPVAKPKGKKHNPAFDKVSTGMSFSEEVLPMTDLHSIWGDT